MRRFVILETNIVIPVLYAPVTTAEYHNVGVASAVTFTAVLALSKLMNKYISSLSQSPTLSLQSDYELKP